MNGFEDSLKNAERILANSRTALRFDDLYIWLFIAAKASWLIKISRKSALI